MGNGIGYNEENAVAYIRNNVPAEVSGRYSDDDILTIIDIIWDYYEQKGLLSLNDFDAEEELLNIDELTEYVKKVCKEDDSLSIDATYINHIVKGELGYEESLEDII